MIIFRLIIVIMTFAISFAGGDHHKDVKVDQNAKNFGGKITSQKRITLSEAMGDYDKIKGKSISFVGKVEKVCEKKGCWMTLKDGDKQVRTLFKDYGFFVPANILGKKVRVQGVIEQKTVSAATIRHYMKDEGRPHTEIKKIRKPKKTFHFTADAVEII